MDFPTLNQLKERSTRKWTTYDEDVIPLWIAESDFATAPHVLATIKERVEKESFGYTPSNSQLPQALSDFYDRRYGYRPDPAMVVPIPDVVRGMLLAIQHLTREDSAVVVPVPIYPPFLQLPKAAGRQKIEVDSREGIDLAAVERAFADGAGSILLANPTNPLGVVYSEDFLRELTELAARYDARVIVDEIHAPLVYEGSHTVAASVSDTAARVCVTATAISKAWNVAGLKCGQLIFSNEKDKEVWDSLTGVTKDGTGTLGVFAAEACYRDDSSFLDDQVAYLAQTRTWLVEKLEEAVPGIRCTVPQATYLMWLDFSDTAIGAEQKPAQWLREHARVALNEGVTFGAYGAHHARLNFATSREILSEAVDRIAAAVRDAE